jgi:hypothetical protein
MTSKSLVKTGMLPISSTATVEAVEANIEAGRIVLARSKILIKSQNFYYTMT